jgi:uncharacterized protein YuzE
MKLIFMVMNDKWYIDFVGKGEVVGIVIFIQFPILRSVITKTRMRYTKISELEKERHHSICF